MTIINPELGEVSLALPRIPKEMISVREREDGRTHVRINSSSLSIIQECLRKAKYSLHEKWRAADEAPATLFGRAIHKALEVFYSGDVGDRKLVKLEDLEPLAYNTGHIEKTLVGRAVQAFVKEAQPLSPLPDTDKRSITNGIWILSEYFKTYIDDPYVAYADEKGPFIEREFSYELLQTDATVIEIFGTIDFAFRDVRSGQIIVGDHKTASFLSFGGQSYFDREKPNHQYTMYMLGAKKVFGLDVEDFMVNVVEVKARPKTKAAKGVSFPRQITKRTEEDFEELKEVLMHAVGDYLISLDYDVWPMGGVDACNKYGGCQFKQVCASPKSLRETILKNKFTKGDISEVK